MHSWDFFGVHPPAFLLQLHGNDCIRRLSHAHHPPACIGYVSLWCAAHGHRRCIERRRTHRTAHARRCVLRLDSHREKRLVTSRRHTAPHTGRSSHTPCLHPYRGIHLLLTRQSACSTSIRISLARRSSQQLRRRPCGAAHLRRPCSSAFVVLLNRVDKPEMMTLAVFPISIGVLRSSPF